MFKKHNISLWLAFLFLPTNYTLYASLFPQQELRYNWNAIDMSDELYNTFQFPHDFSWGVATSAFQNEGTTSGTNKFCKNNWTEDVTKSSAGSSCCHWQYYKEDIKLIKELGVNSYRFSIDWSKIEPEQGVFDQEVMDHYKDIVDELIKHDIKPIVCLFHFTWPLWFDKKNAFEDANNIQDFVEFGCYVFEQLHDKVSMWMTFNEPDAYAMEGYWRGHCPPNKTSFRLAGHVLKNFLNAHVALYHECKQIDPQASIGFTKIMCPLDPYHVWNPLEHLGCRIFNHLLHDSIFIFFKTGTYNWLFVVTDYNKDACGALDFIGINYYTHVVIKQKSLWDISPAKREFEPVADNGSTIYPEGLYRAIQHAATLNIPIYVSENGLADDHDIHKNDFIKKHLYVINRALKDGYNVKGYCYWTLMDNFEWDKGFAHKFGLYHVDFATQKRTLREGAKPFVRFLKSQSYNNC